MTLGAIEKFIPINEEGFEPLCDKRIDWLLEMFFKVSESLSVDVIQK